MAAAVRIIATQGTGVATAAVAKEAGISTGSLFTYFATKSDLLNQVYVELKTEAGRAASDLPTGPDVRALLQQSWRNWLAWSVRCPDKHRALTHLSVSKDLTPESRALGRNAMAGLAALVESARSDGPLREEPLDFVAALIGALADTVTGFMLDDPSRSDGYATAGFEALWRILA